VLPGLDQFPRVFTAGFGGGVTGQLGKSRVNPFDCAGGIGNDNGVGRAFQSGALQAQGFLGLLAFGDILISAQYADNGSLSITQGDFAGQQVYSLSRRGGLGFLKQQSGLPAFNYHPVISPIQLRLFPPGYGIIIFPNNLCRGLTTGIPGKRGVTAKIHQVEVFPENPYRDGVEHGQQ